ncbi:MAG: polyhydroxyalkanoic acid system family protein [Desulfobacterales bacterium]|nr:polyhydroxyalkanoic acid system family protein [Desulfobacterales bacterium]
MPRIKISVPHNLRVDEVRDRIKNLLGEFKNKTAYKVSRIQESWVDGTAHFSLRIMGFFVEGSLYVEPSRVRLEGKFPVAALPFKSMVQRDIIDSARKFLS